MAGRTAFRISRQRQSGRSPRGRSDWEAIKSDVREEGQFFINQMETDLKDMEALLSPDGLLCSRLRNACDDFLDFVKTIIDRINRAQHPSFPEEALVFNEFSGRISTTLIQKAKEFYRLMLAIAHEFVDTLVSDMDKLEMDILLSNRIEDEELENAKAKCWHLILFLKNFVKQHQDAESFQAFWRALGTAREGVKELSSMIFGDVGRTYLEELLDSDLEDTVIPAFSGAMPRQELYLSDEDEATEAESQESEGSWIDEEGEESWLDVEDQDSDVSIHGSRDLEATTGAEADVEDEAESTAVIPGTFSGWDSVDQETHFPWLEATCKENFFPNVASALVHGQLRLPRGDEGAFREYLDDYERQQEQRQEKKRRREEARRNRLSKDQIFSKGLRN